MKEQKFKIFMLFPLIPLLAAFVFDKAFFIGDFPYYFINTASFANYEHKEKLVLEMKDYLARKERKKVLALFGNSRTTPFSNKYIEKTYPDWILYNFSVPGGTSDYFYYLMGKLKENDVRPDFIIFTVTPQGFNSASNIQMDEVMIYALPPSFIMENFGLFRIDDITNYIAKKLFLSYKNKPLLTTILKRMKNDSMEKKLLVKFIENNKTALEKTRGSIALNKHEPEVDPLRMRKNAEDIFRNFLNPFVYSESQHTFMEKSLIQAEKMGIQSALLWARVSPDLRQMKDEIPVVKTAGGKRLTIREAWSLRQKDLAQKYSVDFIDMNYSMNFKCDRFHDASHMAGLCFDEFTDYLFLRVIQNYRTDLE